MILMLEKKEEGDTLEVSTIYRREDTLYFRNVTDINVIIRHEIDNFHYTGKIDVKDYLMVSILSGGVKRVLWQKPKEISDEKTWWKFWE